MLSRLRAETLLVIEVVRGIHKAKYSSKDLTSLPIQALEHTIYFLIVLEIESLGSALSHNELPRSGPTRKIQPAFL